MVTKHAQHRLEILKMSEKGVERYAGVLLLPSLALLVEGATRFVTNSPGDDITDLSRIQEANLVCGIFLVVLGLSGLITGTAALVYVDNPTFAQATFLLSCSIGLVALINFVFAVPFSAFNNDTLPLLYPDGEFARQQQLGLMWLGGISMSFFLSGCVHGLQLLSVTALLCCYMEKNIIKGNWCIYLLYAIVAFTIVGAVGKFAFACIARVELGTNAQILPPLIVVSNVVTYSNIPLVAGMILLVNSFILISTIFLGEQNLPLVNFGGLVQLAWFLSAYVLTNMGLGGSGFAGSAAIVTVLTTVATLTPIFVFNEIYRIISIGEKNHEATVAELEPPVM